MEINNNVNILLQKIKTTQGDSFTYEQEKIDKAVRLQGEQFSNLAIKILAIVGGFLGAAFLSVFVGLLGAFDSEIGMMLLGIFFVGLAIFMNRSDASTWIDSMSISIYLAGLLCIGFVGLDFFDDDENFIILLLLVIGVTTFFVVKGYILRILCVLVFNGSLLALIINNNINTGFHFLIALNVLAFIYLTFYEVEIISKNEFSNTIYNPLRDGVLASLTFGLMMLANSWKYDIRFEYLWISFMVILVANFFAIYKIMESLNVENEKIRWGIFVVSALLLLPTFYAPAIGGAMLILFSSYHIGHRTGIVLGVVGLLYFMIQFYYDLNWTLLVKSIVLMGTGVLFLIGYFIFNNFKTTTNEQI